MAPRKNQQQGGSNPGGITIPPVVFAPPEDEAMTPAEQAERNVEYQIEADRRNPVGVNPGHVATRRTGPGTRMADAVFDPFDPEGFAVEVTPGYMNGAGQAMWAGASIETIAWLQEQLVHAGLIGADDAYPKGVYDNGTDKAFDFILAYANAQGLTWEAALAQYQSGYQSALSAGKGPRGPKGPTFTPRLSNPDDLKKVFKQVTMQNLGGNFLDEAQVSQMVEAYNQIELGSQRQAFNAAVGGGGTTVEAPQADTFAEGELAKIDPTGVKAAKTAAYASRLEQMLAGG